MLNCWQLGLLVGLMLSSRAEGKRISQIKCDEYIKSTTTITKVISLTRNPIPLEIQSFNCPKTVDLIIGGEDAKEGEFRHHVILGWETEDQGKYDFHCGGTLISDQYVLTAAHCRWRTGYTRPKPAIVRFAELNLNVDSYNQFDIDIESIQKHPSRKLGLSYHDIALVRLKEKVTFSAYVRPACLWDDMELNFTTVIATGFGVTEDEKLSDTLRKVQLEIQDSSDCWETIYGTRSFRHGIMDHQLCIGSREGNRDTCQGDSGGPVQVLLNPKGCIYHVIGITSKGPGSCGDGPAIYTKVASYIDWIESIVWPTP